MNAFGLPSIDGNAVKRFPKRLTRWMLLDELKSCQSLYHKYHGECYGREYIIKSNRKKISPKFAIFIKKENKLRRVPDIIFKEKIALDDLTILMLPNKQEGISILKTMKMMIDSYT